MEYVSWITQAWLRQKSPRPDSGRKRVWVCVFSVLHEHTEHWAGGALCSLIFSFSWPLALASTACFLQSRLLEAMALLYSLCRCQVQWDPDQDLGWKWSSLTKCVIALWSHSPAKSLCHQAGPWACPFSAMGLMASQEGFEGAPKHHPEELAQQEAARALCGIVVQVSVLTGCVLHAGTPVVVTAQLSQWGFWVFLPKWTLKNISFKGRVTYWNPCQAVQPREIVLLFTSRQISWF